MHWYLYMWEMIDVLQRGLDFRHVRLIIHFGVPASGADNTFKSDRYFCWLKLSYYQRSGRTGRAKDEGVVLTILGKKDKAEKNGVSLASVMFKTLEEDQIQLLKFNEGNFYQEMTKVLEFEKDKKKQFESQNWCVSYTNIHYVYLITPYQEVAFTNHGGCEIHPWNPPHLPSHEVEEM